MIRLTRPIIGAAALLVSAVALAGCGGGGNNTAGTTVGTTVGAAGGVAGVQTTKSTTSFRMRVQGLETQLQAAVQKLQNGNLAGAANAGGSVLMHCQSLVQSKTATRASTTQQQEAVSHVRLACQDLANATSKGTSGDMTAARSLAKQALAEVQAALKQLR